MVALLSAPRASRRRRLELDCGSGEWSITGPSQSQSMESETHQDDSPTEHYYELGLAGFDDLGDQLLYHYTRAETALNYILPARTLRLNPYRAMRDPLENKELPLMLRY